MCFIFIVQNIFIWSSQISLSLLSYQMFLLMTQLYPRILLDFSMFLIPFLATPPVTKHYSFKRRWPEKRLFTCLTTYHLAWNNFSMTGPQLSKMVLGHEVNLFHEAYRTIGQCGLKSLSRTSKLCRKSCGISNFVIFVFTFKGDTNRVLCATLAGIQGDTSLFKVELSLFGCRTKLV